MDIGMQYMWGPTERYFMSEDFPGNVLDKKYRIGINHREPVFEADN
jgi:hypothetical protein